MSEAFQRALQVRDAIASCVCCEDAAESQERLDVASELLEWVVAAQAELAALRARVRPVAHASAPRQQPKTPAERARSYRLRKRQERAGPDVGAVTPIVTDRHVTHHENRHVTRDAERDARPPQAPPAESSSGEISLSSARSQDLSFASEKRARVTDRHVTARDAERDGLTFAAAVDADEPGIDGHGIADHVAIRIAEATGKRWDAMAYVHDLLWIAHQPVSELELVLQAIAADPWATANAGLVNPRHVRKHWPKYADGPRKVVSGAELAQDREAADAEAARLRRQLDEQEGLARQAPFDLAARYERNATHLRAALAKVRERIGEAGAA